MKPADPVINNVFSIKAAHKKSVKSKKIAKNTLKSTSFSSMEDLFATIISLADLNSSKLVSTLELKKLEVFKTGS